MDAHTGGCECERCEHTNNLALAMIREVTDDLEKGETDLIIVLNALVKTLMYLIDDYASDPRYVAKVVAKYLRDNVGGEAAESLTVR
jgi:hypothetical protein